MPVHIDTHNPEIDLTPGTTKSDIVAFLYSNPEYGYKPAEIRNQLTIPHGTATTTLKRLQEDGFIGKTQDGYYHALENREDLQRYVSSLDQLERMFRQPIEEEATSGSESGASNTADDRELEDELDSLAAEIE